MFDWNEEELTNIIWGEAGENDDHIVPFPDELEEKPPVLYRDHNKDASQGASATSLEQKKAIPKTKHPELESSSNYEGNKDPPASGFGLDSWSDLSFSNDGKNHGNFVDAGPSTSLNKIWNNGSSRDETSRFDNDSENFQNQQDREQGDFVDYGWASIGSFDDLERIFSNSDPIFGDVSVGNSDKLWSSSKDVTSSPVKPSPLPIDSSGLDIAAVRTSSEIFELKAEYKLEPSQPFLPGNEKSNEISSDAPQAEQASIDTIKHSGGKNKLLEEKASSQLVGKSQTSCIGLGDGTEQTQAVFLDKGNRQKKFLKGQKTEEKSEVRKLKDICGSWSSSGSQLQQFNGQYAPSIVNPCSPLVLNQQGQFHPESLHQKHFSSPLVVSPVYGNMGSAYPAILPQLRPGEGNRKPMSSSSEVSPGNASSSKTPADISVNPPAMTPQEKIEKLRRRQQMRAILAIQKQQQQFNSLVSVIEHPTVEGGNFEIDESLSNFPSLDPSSPFEQDDSNTISISRNDCRVEDSILYRLKGTIAKLDIGIRLCIRDSLFRLAQSARQRQYGSDISSSNTSSRDEILGKMDLSSHDGSSKMPDVETETNPIDRTVAHLLFHRPLEFSGKPVEAPESPTSAKLPSERAATCLRSIQLGCFPETSGSAQVASPRGLETCCLFSDVDQSRNSSCLEAPDNASTIDPVDGEETKVESSK